MGGHFGQLFLFLNQIFFKNICLVLNFIFGKDRLLLLLTYVA